IPFAGMPHWDNPTRGWIATANNRVAADDYPYALSGTWGNGLRAVRIRQMLEGRPKFRVQDFGRLQQDSLSLRAVECVPRLIDVLRHALDAESSACKPEDAHRVRQALEFLAVWDCRIEPDRVAASIFNVFFARWCDRVAQARFAGETATL